MKRIIPALLTVVVIGCECDNIGADAGTSTDSGALATGEPSCDVPQGGGVDDVELVQEWEAFVADESHFACAQDDDCVVVNFNDDGLWCECVSGGLTAKEGIAVNTAHAEEAEAMTGRALSDECPELRTLLEGQGGACDGNPPIGAICTAGRCELDFDPCGYCGVNPFECGDAGP